jgi:hypothetical protein
LTASIASEKENDGIPFLDFAVIDQMEQKNGYDIVTSRGFVLEDNDAL